MVPVDSSLCFAPARLSTFPLSKAKDPSLMKSYYPQLQSVQDLEQVTTSLLPRQHQHQQQQHSFFRSEFSSPEPMKHQSQFLRPFFDELPKSKNSWLDIEEDRSNQALLSKTQLSMTFPMAAPSDFSGTSSPLLNGEFIAPSSLDF